MTTKERPYLERCLKPGWYMYWQHQTYHIIACNKEQYLSIDVENVNDSKRHTFRIEELLLSVTDDQSAPIFAPTREQLNKERESLHPFPEVAPQSGIPEDFLENAKRIITTVEKVEFNFRVIQEQESKRKKGPDEKLKTSTELLKQARQLVNPPIGLTSFYKHRKSYHKYSGDSTQIAASMRRSTYHQGHLDKAQLHFLDTMITLYYREDRASKPAMVYRLAESALEHHTDHYWIDPCKCGKQIPQDLLDEIIQVLEGKLSIEVILKNPEKAPLLKKIKFPSRGFYYQYFHWFESLPNKGREAVNSRHGAGTWEQFYMIFDTFVHRATFPLQYVFADYYLLDVFIVDELTRNRIDRLWVTMLIDAYSRSILGMALLYEEPCVESIQSALLHAIWPKSTHKAFGIEGEWACYGIPHQIFLDNAWANHSHSLENLARVIGQKGKYHTIDLVFRPPYKARYGALIESLFGTLSTRIKQELAGAIQSSDPKDVRKAAKEACLLYTDIERYLQEFIVRYQHTEHSALGGMTPHDKWMEGMQAGVPIVPPLTPAIKRLFLRMHSETRNITSKGVSAFGLNYTAGVLAAAEKIGTDSKPIEYSFRYDPKDISTIALYREEHYIADLEAKELRRPDGSLKPTGLWELKMAKALAKEQKGKTEDWLSYLNEAEKLKKKRKSEQKEIQKKLKKLGQNVGNEESLEQEDKEIVNMSLDDDAYQTQLLAKFES